MKLLIIRQGAYGDMICITPVLRYLKSQGHEIHVLTQDRGVKILKNNPNVDFVYEVEEKRDRSDEELHKMWEDKEKEIAADKVINFTESIECNVALHPRSPRYNWTKEERRSVANLNYYEETFDWMERTTGQTFATNKDYVIDEFEMLKPEIFYTDEELSEARKYIRPDKFNMLVCLSGSGKNKAYPWMPAVMGDCIKNINDIHIITIGDELCQLLEVKGEKVTNLAGKIPIRISMALTGMVDLLVSPDTGVLHASGQYNTPKIGLLGHSPIENITKHFKSDYSIQADERFSECAPCFRLIYNVEIQCPREPLSGASWCMGVGIKPELVYERIREVYGNYCRRKETVLSA